MFATDLQFPINNIAIIAYANFFGVNFMMDLKDTQSALILDASDDGEITVEIATKDLNSLSGALCQAIATKLMEDEAFQGEIMDMIEIENDED